MKKIIRLTESDIENIVKRVILEQKEGKTFNCKRNQRLADCLKLSGMKGNVMFNASEPTQLFSQLYQVKQGDTWYGIMNKVLQLDGFYGVGDRTAPDAKDRRANYERYSKINLDMNPKLNGSMTGIKAGDILHLEGPYD